MKSMTCKDSWHFKPSYLFKHVRDAISVQYRTSICQDYFETLDIFVSIQFNSLLGWLPEINCYYKCDLKISYFLEQLSRTEPSAKVMTSVNHQGRNPAKK